MQEVLSAIGKGKPLQYSMQEVLTAIGKGKLVQHAGSIHKRCRFSKSYMGCSGEQLFQNMPEKDKGLRIVRRLSRRTENRSAFGLTPPTKERENRKSTTNTGIILEKLRKF